MAVLSIPEKKIEIRDPEKIKKYFNDRGLLFDQWTCDVVFEDTATQEEILEAYATQLEPFMEEGNYQTADVISINSLTEKYDEIREVFLSEHTHTEDEIRFFVDGQGLFWFNLEKENQSVFNLLCEKGDLISVPAGTKHWFDAGATDPFVKAIRIFTKKSGWTPHYTESKIEEQFSDFDIPDTDKIKYILTDIEGTTTSVSFVYETLFPYFIDNAHDLLDIAYKPEIKKAFDEVRRLAKEEGEELKNNHSVVRKLINWAKEDKKITVLKELQGLLWVAAYQSDEIRGHIYKDVIPKMEEWKELGIQFGVYSSGSVDAQKLLYTYSEDGDITPFFSNFFDTKIGNKRETESYAKIAATIAIEPQHILFLSDVAEELAAAAEAGYQTIQIVREGNRRKWKRYAKDFWAVQFNS